MSPLRPKKSKHYKKCFKGGGTHNKSIPKTLWNSHILTVVRKINTNQSKLGAGG